MSVVKQLTKIGEALAAATVMFSAASAVEITVGDFDGTETLIDFQSVAGTGGAGDLTLSGATFTSASGAYNIQLFGGVTAGGSGAGYNTDGDNSAENSFTIAFDDDVIRFGMDIGAGQAISGQLVARDGGGNIVETLDMGLFTSRFVGLEFAAAVALIEIIRGPDSPTYFTFIDNVRFLAAPVSDVPLPAALPLFLVGLAGIGFARRNTAA